MLRRLFRNRSPGNAAGRPKADRPTGDKPKADRSGADGPAPGDQPDTPQDALLALPPEQAAARIAALDDLDELIELALRARGELRERILTHPRLAPAAALTVLEKRSRARDKSVNRHARRRLEERRTLQHDAAANQTRAEELAAALNRRETGADERAWRERQHALQRQLDDTLDAYATQRTALAAFGDELADLEPLRVDPATLPPLVAARPPAADAESHHPEPGAEPGPAADAATAADAEPFEPLVTAFRELDAAMAAGEPFADVAARRQQLTERWLTAADHRPPEPAQHAVFEAVSHRFRELAEAVERLGAVSLPPLPDAPLALPETPQAPAAAGAPSRDLWAAVAERRALSRRLDQLCHDLRWPAWAPAAPELERITAAAAALRGELTRADALLDAELDALTGQITALTAAIDDGSLTTAQSLLSRVRSLCDALPEQATRDHARRLGKQAARLAELKDWQTFATTPKRESLVDTMAALAASPLPAAEQADRIKQLREEWKSLGPVTQAADGRLADRFNAEAEKAFEPCRAYFAELAEQRKANLAERRRLCDQLEHYLHDTDWQHADMKAAEKIMRAAREEWRLYHPVDRNPGKRLEAHFERLQSELYDRVKAEWDRNLKAKEALVAEAEALIEADQPVTEKVAAAKTLQRRWRDVGITPRRPDQRLWRDFRGACDRIFSAREDARQRADAALADLTQRLEDALDGFEKRLQSIEAADASDVELREFRQQTADAERLPAARRRAVTARRAALVARYDALLAERQRLAVRARLAAIERWDAAASDAEAAGQPLTLTDDAPLADDVIEARRAAAGGTVPRDALRRLAVRAELMAGRPSPAEDEALRMEVQVERLQAGLSGGTDDSVAALADAWCVLGPRDAATVPLRERFFTALAAVD